MNTPPVNKKEQLVFTILMVFFMAIVMTSYNVVLHNGFSVESLKTAWLVFPFTFVVAFVCEWFIVGKVAMKLAYKVIRPDDQVIKKILVTALFFVTGMVLLMSFFGLLISGGISPDFGAIWMKSIPVNFAMAYPLQVLIAGPLVRFVFRKLFPLGTIVVPAVRI